MQDVLHLSQHLQVQVPRSQLDPKHVYEVSLIVTAVSGTVSPYTVLNCHPTNYAFIF